MIARNPKILAVLRSMGDIRGEGAAASLRDDAIERLDPADETVDIGLAGRERLAAITPAPEYR